MSGEPGADFLSEMDDDLRGCSKSCICDGVGLSPALELNKRPKKCAALVVSILMEMLDEGIDGLPKKVIKEYLHDYDDRFVHKGSLFRIVEPIFTTTIVQYPYRQYSVCAIEGRTRK